MSYPSRRAKRMARAARRRDQRAGRESGTAGGRWWLTIATTGCRCACCGVRLKRGDEIVYLARSRTVLARPCADRQGTKYKAAIGYRDAERSAA
jgi:hypothetical protein